MGQTPPFKILGSSDSVFAQKKLIFLLVKVIIIPEKNPRKPVSILREKIKAFKLLKHIKLLVSDSSLKRQYMTKSSDFYNILTLGKVPS
jgi:hypothetical protein